MTGSPISCHVSVNGARVADGSPDDDPLAPNVLSGLEVTWGRGSTMDQPEASTCNLTVTDRRGSVAFLDVFRVGLPLDVHARATLYPVPSLPTFLDPTFATTAPGAVPASVRPGTAAVAAAPGRGVSIRPARSTAAAVVDVAPAPFVTDDPDAWDQIAATSPGQTWGVQAQGMLPSWTTATVQAVVFLSPDPSVAPVPVGPVQTLDGGTDPRWLGVPIAYDVPPWTVVPDRTGWLGVRVRIFPAGPQWDQLPPELTWDDVGSSATWDAVATSYLTNVNTFAPDSGVIRDVHVFAGRITDLEVSWDDEAGEAVLDVVATDFTVSLENRNVGSVPWPVEPMADRFNRVLALSGIGDLDAIIAPRPAALPMSYQDVDSQGSMALLTDYAVSTDAVLWSAVHATTGPYLWVEDPAERVTGSRLAWDGSQVVIVTSLDGRIELSACDVLLDPTSWRQDTSDVLTRAAVQWQEQGVDDQGKVTTTDRTVTLVNSALESELGALRGQVSTLLVSADDAYDVAANVLARSQSTDWRATELEWHLGDEALDAATITRALSLIDGTTRIGAALTLTDLPAWAPVDGPQPVFLEGGQLSFTDGAWVLAMTISRAAGLGASVTWDQLDPAWTWDDMGTITWDQLSGVGPPVSETIAP